VIRQAISCDICGTEKKQTNHWFVAYDQSGELRVSGWNSRNRLRPGSKHLCGQTCLHKLVDDFMAKALSARVQQPAATEETESEVEQLATGADASLTSDAAYLEVESSARLMMPTVALPPKPPPHRAAMEVVAMPARIQPDAPAAFSLASGPSLSEDQPRSASKNWRAEAWQRERERELRAVGKPAARRRAGS
jgi:hypothetical protein